ncbi:SDR family NAD(P)-dependent oxidoreductase [Acetobacter oeni]|nr:SDR family NAD(P)-dependent oxidoreductase [Acetobacter oeni]
MGTVLITGGHKGIGLEAATKILEQGGFDLILPGRNQTEVNAVARDLGTRYRARIRTVAIDVASLASVRAGAAAVQAMMVREGAVAPLQVLLLNAGAQFMGQPQYTAEGFEKTFATNCLGHFLLLNLLLGDVDDHGRIVFTASGTHDPETMNGKMVGKAAEPDAVRLATDGQHGKPLPLGGPLFHLQALHHPLRLRTRAASARTGILDPVDRVRSGPYRGDGPEPLGPRDGAAVHADGLRQMAVQDAWRHHGQHPLLRRRACPRGG